MTAVDVVIVSYNSVGELRSCVEPLSSLDGVRVVVVDNASEDDSIASVADLPVTVLPLEVNGGFAHGCNAGWRAGSAPFVLFLNPDARLEAESLDRLRGAVADRSVGIVAPRIVDDAGVLQYSLRRFPSLRSTYAQALFLQKVAPTAAWADEIVRTPATYRQPAAVEWASGACLLVRRELLELLGGWDEGFFLYCEDIDLCRRAQLAGYEVHFEPTAVVTHIGGASLPRTSTLPYLAASRVRYAQLHRSRSAAMAERIGVALEALTRMAVGRGGRAGRIGHARSVRIALTTRRSSEARAA